MLKQKFFVDFLSKIVIYFTTAISGIIVARVAGPKVIGVLAYGLAYVTAFSFIANLFGSSYIKLVSQGEDLRKCNTNYFIVSIISIIIYALIVLSFFLTQKFIFNYKFESKEVEIIIFLSLILYLIGQIYNINEVVFNARMEITKANIPTVLKTITFNISRVIVVIIGFSAIGLIITNLVVALIFLPIIILNFKELDYGEWDKEIFRKSIKISIPMSGLTVIEILINNLDKIILEYTTNIEQVGYYSAAYSIAGVLLLFSRTTGTVLFPLFSKYFSFNDLESIIDKIQIYQRFFFVFIQPIFITLIFFSDSIVLLVLGSKYVPSGNIFLLLLISVYFSIWGMPFGNVITGKGKFNIVLYINIIRFLIYLIFIYILTVFFKLGAMGVAGAVLAQSISLSLFFYFFSYKILKKNFIKPFIPYIIIGSVYIVFLGLVQQHFIVFSPLINILLFFPLTVFVLFIIYFYVGLINKGDIQLLKDILNTKRARQYIKNEIKNNN